MTTNDGGPAFPHGPLGDSMHFEDGRVTHQYPAGLGMSLRDWFAGQALPAIMADHETLMVVCKSIECSSEDAAAHMAYMHADAMLKAREMKQ